MAVSKCAGVSFSNPAEIVAGDNIDVVGDKSSVTISLSDDVTIAGDLTVNGTVVTLNTETLLIEDKNIEMGVIGSPTDSTANGGGITLKGATDKTIIWDNTNDNWTANQDFNLPTGKTFKINNVDINTGGTLSNVPYKDQENLFIQEQTITIPNTVNDVGLVVNQNDTTNNPKTVVINNAGTGTSLEIDNTSLVVTAGGNVGIGTTAPTTVLNVEAAGVDLLKLRRSTASGGSAILFENGDAEQARVWLDGTGNVRLDVGSVIVTDTKLIILSNGNVGIGTTAPTAPLHVVGLPVFANNAAAITGGLTVGAFYRTGGDPDQLSIVH